MIRTLSASVLVAAGLALGFASAANAAPYANCTEAARDGASDIPSSSEYYGPHLDRDDDGIGCES